VSVCLAGDGMGIHRARLRHSPTSSAVSHEVTALESVGNSPRNVSDLRDCGHEAAPDRKTGPRRLSLLPRTEKSHNICERFYHITGTP
jgi:hypothetical protein